MSKPNIAIMFLGLTRFDINIFKQHIYPAYKNLEFANVSVFFQLWDNKRLYPNEEFHNELFNKFNGLIREKCNVEDLVELDPAAITTISNLDLAEKIAYFDKVELQANRIKYDALYKSTVDDIETFLWDLRRYVRVIAGNCQYYSMEETYNTIKQYETANNMTFDYVIKTRYDVAVESKFSYNLERAVKSINHDRPVIITPSLGIWKGEDVELSPTLPADSIVNYNGMTDTILVMNKSAADLFYNNLLYNASKLVTLASKMSEKFNEEKAFYTICKIKNISIIEYYFNHLLLREELLIKYTIDNLFNNVASVNKEISYVDSESIKLERTQRIAIHDFVNKLKKNNSCKN
jgi:hypothetical protein